MTQCEVIVYIVQNQRRSGSRQSLDTVPDDVDDDDDVDSVSEENIYCTCLNRALLHSLVIIDYSISNDKQEVGRGRSISPRQKNTS